jgi:hypothetical protein
MLRVGKQPLVGRSTGSPTLKEAARETMFCLVPQCQPSQLMVRSVPPLPGFSYRNNSRLGLSWWLISHESFLLQFFGLKNKYVVTCKWPEPIWFFCRNLEVLSKWSVLFEWVSRPCFSPFYFLREQSGKRWGKKHQMLGKLLKKDVHKVCHSIFSNYHLFLSFYNLVGFNNNNVKWKTLMHWWIFKVLNFL